VGTKSADQPPERKRLFPLSNGKSGNRELDKWEHMKPFPPCSQSVPSIYSLENGLNKGCSHCSHCSHSMTFCACSRRGALNLGGAVAQRRGRSPRCAAPACQRCQDPSGGNPGFPQTPILRFIASLASNTHKTCALQSKKKSGPIPKHQTAFPRFDVFEDSTALGSLLSVALSSVGAPTIAKSSCTRPDKTNKKTNRKLTRN